MCIYSCVFNVSECPVVRDQGAVLKAVVLISQNVRSVVHTTNSQPCVHTMFLCKEGSHCAVRILHGCCKSE